MTKEEITNLCQTWRQRAFQAADREDWDEASRSFKEVAFYEALLGFIKRNFE